MVLIAGCTGSKKSTYLHHIVNQNIIAGHRVAYCCIKDKPFDVGIEIIGENVHVNAEYIKRGIMTEEDWGKLTSSPSSLDGENLTLILYSEVSDSNKILELVANSGAEIVVIDDTLMNGTYYKRPVESLTYPDGSEESGGESSEEPESSLESSDASAEPSSDISEESSTENP